jgi:2-amino-4-hydroxy-6-hydroxymethyldihydropteridine diphosphokinase
MATVYLGLGSNVDAERNLHLALDEIRRAYGEPRVSPVYCSAAIGFEGPDFLNLVVAVETEDSPEHIAERMESVHRLAGRRREDGRFVARPLDIDILLYDDLVRDIPPRLPRHDVLDYAFVLRPLADLAPDLVHPVTGRTLAAHWEKFDRDSQPLMRVEVDL